MAFLLPCTTRMWKLYYHLCFLFICSSSSLHGGIKVALVAPCANILSSQATSAKLHNIALEPIIPLFLEIAQCVRQKLSQPGILGTSWVLWKCRDPLQKFSLTLWASTCAQFSLHRALEEGITLKTLGEWLERDQRQEGIFTIKDMEGRGGGGSFDQ